MTRFRAATAISWPCLTVSDPSTSQMGIDHDHVAHLAGAHIVDAMHAGVSFKRTMISSILILRGGAIHQVIERIPAEFPAHLGHHQAHDQGGPRVEQRKPHQVAHNAQSHHQR